MGDSVEETWVTLVVPRGPGREGQVTWLWPRPMSWAWLITRSSFHA